MNEYKELKVGDDALDFKSLSSNGETVSLSDFKGKNVVLYFYPKDLTPGCTKQACDFRDEFENFKNLDTVILGVSHDPLTNHKKFVEKHEIPFLLISDENKEISTMYGSYKEKSMFGKKYMGIERTTFVIDKNGKIAKIYPKVKVINHIRDVLEYIKEELN